MIKNERKVINLRPINGPKCAYQWINKKNYKRSTGTNWLTPGTLLSATISLAPTTKTTKTTTTAKKSAYINEKKRSEEKASRTISHRSIRRAYRDISTYILHETNFWLLNGYNWNIHQNWASNIERTECTNRRKNFSSHRPIDMRSIILEMRTIDEERGENQWKYRKRKKKKPKRNVRTNQNITLNYLMRARLAIVCVSACFTILLADTFFYRKKYVR